MAGSGQRSELEGIRTISEAKGEMVRLRKQMDALQRGAMKQEEYLDTLQCEAREHDKYLDRLRGEFDEADKLLPRPVKMMRHLAAYIEEAEAEKADFQELLDDDAKEKAHFLELLDDAAKDYFVKKIKSEPVFPSFGNFQKIFGLLPCGKRGRRVGAPHVAHRGLSSHLPGYHTVL